jgi:hypothetical protein
MPSSRKPEMLLLYNSALDLSNPFIFQIPLKNRIFQEQSALRFTFDPHNYNGDVTIRLIMSVRKNLYTKIFAALSTSLKLSR